MSVVHERKTVCLDDYVRANSCYTTLNNEAVDGVQDVLLLKVRYETTEFESVLCQELDDSLLIFYCKKPRIIVRDWFKGPEYRHLTMKTEDAVTFDAFPKDNAEGNSIECLAVGLDYTKSLRPVTVDLSADKKNRRVTKIIGPQNHSMNAVGNKEKNTFVCFKSDCFLQGNEAADTYIFQGTGTVWINNCDPSTNPDQDFLSLNATWKDIKMSKSGGNILITIQKKQDRPYQKYEIVDWLTKHEICRHMVILTSFNEILSIALTKSDDLVAIPLILDYENRQSKIEVDLGPNGLAPGLPAGSDLSEVTSVFGPSSGVGGRIRGNEKNNIFTCTGANTDISMASEGIDTFFLKPGCNGNLLDCRNGERLHRVMLHCDYTHMSACLNDQTQSLVVGCSDSPTGINVHCPTQNSFSLKYNLTHADYCRNFEIFTSDGLQIVHADSKITTKAERMRATKRDLFVVDALLISSSSHPFCCDLDLEDYPPNEEVKIMKTVTRATLNIPYEEINLKGNAEDNTLAIGNRIADAWGAHLEGKNGSDTYELPMKYGTLTINNYAEDMFEDELKFRVPFDEITVTGPNSEESVMIFDRYHTYNETNQVVLQYYWKDERYRHLRFVAQDDTSFELSREPPYKHACEIDKTRSELKQHIQVSEYVEEARSVEVLSGSGEAKSVIFGTLHSKSIQGGPNDDFISGGPGDETIDGDDGDDIIRGMGGNDYLNGGSGSDILYGGPGDDTLFGGKGSDVLSGGDGIDTVIFEGFVMEPSLTDYSGVIVSLMDGTASILYPAKNESLNEYDDIIGVEHIFGTYYDDNLIDDNGDNRIMAGSGEDSIFSYGGNDVLVGGEGPDTYNLVKASGLKMIRNYDNDSAIDIMYFSRVSGCSYRYVKDLVVTVPGDENIEDELVVVVADFYAGTKWQHLNLYEIVEGKLGNVSVSHVKLIDLALDYSVEKPTELSVELLSADLDRVTVHIQQKCTSCKNIFVLYYTELLHNETSHISVEPNKDITIGGLRSGSLYSFFPALMLCGQVAERGPSAEIATKPNRVHSIEFEVESGYYLRIKWKASEQDKDVAHLFGYEISHEINTGFPQSPRSETVRTVKPFYWIRLPLKSTRVFVSVKIRAVALGTVGDWTRTKQFEINTCSNILVSDSCLKDRTESVSGTVQKFCSLPESRQWHSPLYLLSSNLTIATRALSTGGEVAVSCPNDYRSVNSKLPERAVSTCYSGHWHPPLQRCQPICNPSSLPGEITEEDEQCKHELFPMITEKKMCSLYVEKKCIKLGL